MNPLAREVSFIERPDVFQTGSGKHFDHVADHILAHQPLIFSRCAIDLENRQSPFVFLRFVQRHFVLVIRKHLAEGGRTKVPLSWLGERILESSSDTKLGNGARPTIATGAALVSESTQVLTLLSEKISVTRNVRGVGTASEEVFVIEAFDSSLRARTEVMVHQVVSKLA